MQTKFEEMFVVLAIPLALDMIKLQEPVPELSVAFGNSSSMIISINPTFIIDPIAF